MLVPRFWQKAEGTVRGPSGPYRFELWGWSQESAADALTRARRRLAELVERVRRGEIGGAYLYGSVPLREEIVRSLAGEEAAFRAWLARYETASSAFAACRYLEALGPGRTLPGVHAIVEEHDRRSRALESLPLA